MQNRQQQRPMSPSSMGGQQGQRSGSPTMGQMMGQGQQQQGSQMMGQGQQQGSQMMMGQGQQRMMMAPKTIRMGNSQVSKNRWTIDPNDAVMLLIDHQTGLFQLVKDMDQMELKRNVMSLAKLAKIAKMPCFTTASVPEGPNGPLIPEIHECCPEAVYIPRTGQINAWDNPDWVKAIEKTGRKTLLMAGTLTSVCMALPALSACEAGYRVFCIIDASGNYSKMATDCTIARMCQAGVCTIDTFACFSEVMCTWNREDAWQYAQIMMEMMPVYRTIADFTKQKQQTEQDSDKQRAGGGMMSEMNRMGKMTAGMKISAAES